MRRARPSAAAYSARACASFPAGSETKCGEAGGLVTPELPHCGGTACNSWQTAGLLRNGPRQTRSGQDEARQGLPTASRQPHAQQTRVHFNPRCDGQEPAGSNLSQRRLASEQHQGRMRGTVSRSQFPCSMANTTGKLYRTAAMAVGRGISLSRKRRRSPCRRRHPPSVPAHK